MNIFRLFSKITVVGFLVIAALVVTLTNAPAWAANGRSLNSVLSETEAEMLTYMREEEKSARDVYLVMYEKWAAAIFYMPAVKFSACLGVCAYLILYENPHVSRLPFR